MGFRYDRARPNSGDLGPDARQLFVAFFQERVARNRNVNDRLSGFTLRLLASAPGAHVSGHITGRHEITSLC
jgi:hypothetical protein